MTFGIRERKNIATASNVFIILVAIGVGVGLSVFPPISDDIFFMMSFMDEHNNLHFDFQSGYDNWWRMGGRRLCNLVTICGALLPRWIFGVVSSICIYYILQIGRRLGGFYRSPLTLAVYVLMFLAIYPWVDQMYLFSFQTNYIWPTAASLWIVWRTLSNPGKFSIPTFILCLLLSAWHEGFGAGIAGTLIVLFVLCKPLRNWRTMLYALAIMPGILYLALYRIPGWHKNYFSNRLGILLVYAIPLATFVVMWTYLLLKGAFVKSYRIAKLIWSSNIIALAAMAASGTLFMLWVPTGPRTGSLGVIASCIGICCLGRAIMPRLSLASNQASLALAAAISVFSLAHITLVDMECFKARNATEQVMSAYRDEPGKMQYVDMTLRIDVPWYYFQKPYYDWFAHYKTSQAFVNFCRNDHAPLYVAPASLEHFSVPESRCLPGSPEFMIVDGLLVGPAISTEPEVKLLRITKNDKSVEREFYAVPLLDKDDLAWYYPNNSNLFLKDLYINSDKIEIKCGD